MSVGVCPFAKVRLVPSLGTLRPANHTFDGTPGENNHATDLSSLRGTIWLCWPCCHCQRTGSFGWARL